MANLKRISSSFGISYANRKMKHYEVSFRVCVNRYQCGRLLARIMFYLSKCSPVPTNAVVHLDLLLFMLYMGFLPKKTKIQHFVSCDEANWLGYTNKTDQIPSPLADTRCIKSFYKDTFGHMKLIQHSVSVSQHIWIAINWLEILLFFFLFIDWNGTVNMS